MGEELHPDCINYKRRSKGMGLMFWDVFRKGRMGPGVSFFFGERRKSGLYRDQILLGPLQQFWEESFEDIKLSIVMEGNASIARDGEFRCVCDMISSLICTCASVCLYIHVVAQPFGYSV
jgi:hypothetical protein